MQARSVFVPMTGPEMFGRLLLTVGGLIFLIGLLVILSGRLGLGRLPGDIYIQKENFVFYFPLMTGIIISLIITLIVNILLRR